MKILKLANLKTVVASWSGGIDSTAVVAHLLIRGYSVKTFSLNFYNEAMMAREKMARERLLPYLQNLGPIVHAEASIEMSEFLWSFSPDGVEIPRRNKHIMDWMITKKMMPKGIYNLAMGEYVGADTWVVRDHVSERDADARHLEAYLLHEYGSDYQLFTLRDFGPCRFKSERLQLGLDALGSDFILTTNCMDQMQVRDHCGVCYKCIERAAAFSSINVPDGTRYIKDPRKHPYYGFYMKQMNGDGVEVRGTWEDFQS